MTQGRGAWGIYRDGELYSVERSRWLAQEHLHLLKPGSKHKWRMLRVFVTPVGVGQNGEATTGGKS